MQIWPHSRMDLKKEIRIRGCIVLTRPLAVIFILLKKVLASVTYSACLANHCNFYLSGISHFVLYLLGDVG